MIEEVFRQLALIDKEKQRTIMIGDRKHDILGAKACGIASLGVSFGYAEKGELEAAGATYIVDDLKILEKIVIA